MLIVLGIFFFIVWLVFLKFKWLPFNRTWKIIVWGTAFVIAVVVVGALHYYTPASKSAVVATYTQHIYPLVSGQVDSVFVEKSQSVSAGDKLFSIDPRPFQYAVDNWAAELKLAQIAWDDAKKLVSKGAISKFSADQRLAARDKARAELSEAKYNLENTVVYASSNGIVSLAMLRPGQRADPSAIAMNFISTDETWIAVTVKQNGLRLIAPGQNVMVSFNSAPGDIYESKVAYIPSGVVQGQITPEDATDPFQALESAQDAYPVRIEFPINAPEETRRPGTLAQVTIFTDDGNPINVLAKVLQWITTWANFV